MINWWSVDFDITVNGEAVTFDALDDVTREHIIESIKQGYECGSLE